MPDAVWVDILKQAGYPQDVVVLDFETYFDTEYSLKKISTIEFVMDPRFEMLGLARLIIPGKAPFSPIDAWFFHDAGNTLRWLQGQYGDNLERCTVIVMNAWFDCSILARHYDIFPPYIVDVLGLARHIDPRRKNKLAVLAERYDLPAKGDTDQFKGYGWDMRLGPPTVAIIPGEINKTFTRKKQQPKINVRWIGNKAYQVIERQGMNQKMRGDLAKYACNDAELEFQVFRILLPQLSRPTFELRLLQHSIELFTKPIIGVDFEAGKKLAVAMVAKVDEVAVQVGATRKQLGGEGSFKTLLQEALGNEPVPMKQGKTKMLLAVAKGDTGREYLEKHPIKRVRDLISARAAIKSWPLHAARVNRIMTQAHAAGGLLPMPLAYCKAHTGRWAGGEKINPHNLAKRSLESLIRQVQQLFIAPPGYVLVCTDASQIEARVLAWIAGQWDLITAFAAGEPIYCNFASGVLGRKVRKARADDPPAMAAFFTKDRNLGKMGVLGCGYGMGATRFQIQIKQQYGVDINYLTAERAVKYYRTTYPMIPRFWRDIEYAFKYVTKYPHETRTMSRGLQFCNEDDCTIITLPCGRRLHYLKARVAVDGGHEQIWWPNPQKPGTITNAWGGLICENVVQAMSRDILAEAIFLSEAAGKKIGLRIGLHCHDELVGVVRKQHGEAALRMQLDALRTCPNWAPRLPLDAEGTIMERYGT